MSDHASRYAEKAIVYALLALVAAVWLGFGGLVFIGILKDVAA